jgi:hypothetical protein
MFNPSRFISIRVLLQLVIIAAVLVAAGCGGEAPPPANTSIYPPGSKTDDDVDRELKFDARVEDYEAQGNKLIVNVNQSFTSSPPGIQERAMGYWYNLWQAARTSAGTAPQRSLEIIVRHDGKDIAKWTATEGYKPASGAKPKNEDDDDEADSEN